MTPWTAAHQAPQSMGFSRQEYWSGLPFLSPGDLPDPGIKPRSPTLVADALTSEPPGKPFIVSQFIVLEAKIPRSNCWQICFLLRPFLACEWPPSHCSSCGLSSLCTSFPVTHHASRLPFLLQTPVRLGWALSNSISQFSCSVVSNSLRPHGLQHSRPPVHH